MKQNEHSAIARKKLKKQLMAEFEANGGNLTNACQTVGVGWRTHYDWVRDDDEYAKLYNELREKTRTIKVQKSEDLGDSIVDFVLANGVENVTKDQLHEARSEAEFQRRTLASDTYSTKDKHVVQEDNGRPTWEDVVRTIKGDAEEDEE